MGIGVVLGFIVGQTWGKLGQKLDKKGMGLIWWCCVSSLYNITGFRC